MNKISPVIFLTIGAVVSIYTAPVSLTGAFLLSLLPGGVLLGFKIIWPPILHKNKRLIKGIILMGIGGFLGFIGGFRHHQIEQTFFSSYVDVDSFEGVVIRDSIPYKEGGFIHYLKITRIESKKKGYSTDARGKVVILHKTGKKLFIGRKARFLGNLKKLSSGEYHFLSNVTKDPDLKGYSSVFFFLRQTFHSFLDSRFENHLVRGLFKALFLGAREELSGNLEESFEKSGSLHILALSGLHGGIIYLFIIFLLKPIRSRPVKFIVFTLALGLYLFLVGPGPSLIRASLMLWFLDLSRLFDRDIKPLNILALSAFVIMLFNPSSVYTLSFALSYLAVIGIFLIGLPLYRVIRGIVPPFISLPLALSIGAQLGTAGVVILSFGIIYPGGILASLCLVPLITVFLYLGLGIFFLWPIPGVVFIISRAMEWFLDLILYVGDFFSSVPGWEPASPVFFSVLFFSLFTLLVLFFQRRKLKQTLLPLFCPKE